MILLTLQTPGVVCTSNLWNGFADWVVTAPCGSQATTTGEGVAECVDAALANVNN